MNMTSENKITNDGSSLTVKLDVYLFLDEGTYIAYSPTLDLSGYGETEEDAKESFSIVIEEYISYGLANRNL